MAPGEAETLIEKALQRMRAAYGADVFDEWALIAAGAQRATLLRYAGPRAETFERALRDDVRPLLRHAGATKHHVGDFEMVAEASGTRHDAMLKVGATHFAIFNHTTKSLAEIRANPRWLKAQVHFVALCEAFHADPVRAEPGARAGGERSVAA